jgi:hypothetical protein
MSPIHKNRSHRVLFPSPSEHHFGTTIRKARSRHGEVFRSGIRGTGFYSRNASLGVGFDSGFRGRIREFELVVDEDIGEEMLHDHGRVPSSWTNSHKERYKNKRKMSPSKSRHIEEKRSVEEV